MGFARRTLVLSVAAAGFGGMPAGAQSYPTRPVRLVSPFAPGGGTDILGRIVAQKFSGFFGGNMIVENRAGAGGNVGAQSVARAEPDGYTLLMAVNSYAINANVHRSVPFDLRRDFAPIGMVATSPFVLVVHPSLPVRTVQELVEHAKAHPGRLNYGSAGLATAPHIAGELFKLMTGTDMRHVPYQGSGPNVTGLLRGDVHVSAISLNSVEGFLGTDQMRPIAVMSRTRQPRLPDVPTVAESGLPGFEIDLWYAMLAPRDTPKEIVAKLNNDLKQALEAADLRDRLLAQGFTPVYSTPAELADIIDRDLARWKDVTERINLKMN